MRRLLIIASGLLLLAGCEAEVVQVPPRVITRTLPDAPAAKTFNPADMNVKFGDEKALEALVANHKGKLVFVDYWATWCEPCVEAFPHTVEAYEKYRSQGLAVIAVSFDDPSQYDDPTEAENKVRRFLATHRADFENLISPYESGPEPLEKFDIPLVPHFRLYDRQGKLRFKWDAEPKDLDARLQELLAEK